MKIERTWIMIGGLVVALGCYLWPWYRHVTAGFTMNAFDLAEWASVHPAVRSSSPAMLTTLLLRLPLVAIGVGLVLASGGVRDPRARWLVRGAAALVVMRLFPPVDVFTSARDDPNYRQLVLLTAVAVSVMAAALVVRLPDAVRDWSVAGLLAVGSAAGWWGLSRAGVLLDNFAIDVQIGAGVVGYSVCAGVVLLAAGRGRLKQKRRLIPQVS